ncbi:hypothetical protein [Prosthecochloris sp.]|uniref:hypothetical protein n=1 Tax=Prosthecochloris sp. TaxID=290513 RepID=UPI00257ABECF|nr:hypothetical protein [Prosthecochloris sp.]
MASVNPQKKLRGTASQNAAVTLEEGTIVYLTDTKQIAVHDGSTAGGTVFDILPVQVSSAEKTAGNETAVRGFSPFDIKDMSEMHSTSAFISYALLADQKSQGTDGGTFTSGSDQTRDLNTKKADPDNIVSLSSNQFSLAAGSYLIKWSTPVYDVNAHRSKLYDVTGDNTYVGSSEYAPSGQNGANRSFGIARITISTSTTFEIRHRCDGTKSNIGFGLSCDYSGEVEEYTQVEIYKEK